LKHYLLYIFTTILLAAPAGLMHARSLPDELLAVRNDGKQQQDPKPPKVITARVAHSAENELITLHVSFPDDAQNVKVSVYNILGKLIDIQTVGQVSQGDATFQFQTKGLPNGPYLIVLESGTQRITNKVMVSR
jgi:hypothetical protein